MKNLEDFKESIHKCSKCGICQGSCPLYKATGNDCTVSKGLFIMLQGYLKGELKLSKTIKHYLDLCLKCGKCTDICPSGINALDIIISAKAEYYRNSFVEKLISFGQKYFLFKFIPDLFGIFNKPSKSQYFEKKVIYFGGCGSKYKGDKSIIKILNKLEIEVINPQFNCCGVSLYVRGDLEGFKLAMSSYIKTLKKYKIKDVVTTCASCEKSLKDYLRWVDNAEDRDFLQNISVKNIFEYIKENNLKPKLTSVQKVTYHKPCHLKNYDDIKWLLDNTENLEYLEMNDFDSCCGLNGLTNIKEYRTLSKITSKKRHNILKSGSNTVLTSCLGCEIALNTYSKNQYKVFDIVDFISKNL